jgi:hypothetical protein
MGDGFGLGFDSLYGTGGLNFGAGTSATSALQAGLQQGAKGATSTVAKAGMSLNPIGLALAGGQLALGVAQMVQAGKAREQQVYNQTYQNTLTQKLNEYARQQKNEQIASAFGAKLDFVKGQIENNFLAAQASWTSEQMRLNEIYGRAAFRSQGMQRQLAQAVGSAAAREVYGKSARRGALVSTLGAYGRSRAQLVEQLLSEKTATKMRMERTEQQKRSRDKLAMSQVANLPMPFTAIAQSPSIAAGGRGLGIAANIMGIGQQAFSAYKSV